MKLKLLALAALVGCASVPAGNLPAASVVVTNDHWLDQVVYANCGTTIRVGVARGLGETTLRLPVACVDRSVSFTVDPIGSNSRSVSDAITAVAYDRLALTIPSYDNGYLFISRVR